MTGTDQRSSGPFGDLIRTFHDVRRAASRTSDPDLLPPFNSADVRWSEPGVGSHMVVLEGRGAVEAVLRLRARVAARGGDYRNRFGVVPSFRAALHAGPVVVGEMGDSKLEIVQLGLPHRGGRERERRSHGWPALSYHAVPKGEAGQVTSFAYIPGSRDRG